uniref:RNA-directed DNA polymerase n=1 Tax=Anoplophora glabripennis TaxID=217634 RepID=V5GAM1_ANOGL
MHSFLERVYHFLDVGEYPVGIFCDLSKAFDCVDQKKLMTKLYAYGIRGLALGWVKTFLENRTQYVSINNNNSESHQVKQGVPQGSVLGPVLYLLYVNEIDSLSSSTHFTIYADDTSLITSNMNENALEADCNSLLSNLTEWFYQNSLYININKTKIL